MRITIIQSEIEEAIAEKVLSQMSINENMELKIELSATRGPEGMTATIDVVAKAEEVVEMPKRNTGRKAAAKPAEPAPAASTTTETSNTSTVADETPVDTSTEVASEDTGSAEEAPRTTSIFAGLRKPVNEPVE